MELHVVDQDLVLDGAEFNHDLSEVEVVQAFLHVQLQDVVQLVPGYVAVVVLVDLLDGLHHLLHFVLTHHDANEILLCDLLEHWHLLSIPNRFAQVAKRVSWFVLAQLVRHVDLVVAILEERGILLVEHGGQVY